MVEKKQQKNYYLLIFLLFILILFVYNFKFRKKESQEFQEPIFSTPEIKIDFEKLERLKNLTPIENLTLPEEKGKDNPFSP